jgi:hypothetical protein
VGGVRHNSVLVHRLVCETFHGPRPLSTSQVRHLDGNPANNREGNLKWGSLSENTLDSVAHGTHHLARRETCPQGHPYDKQNTYRAPSNPRSRKCKVCNLERMRAFEPPGLNDPADPRHGTNGGYVYWGCRCVHCLSARREYVANLKH